MDKSPMVFSIEGLCKNKDVSSNIYKGLFALQQFCWAVLKDDYRC